MRIACGNIIEAQPQRIGGDAPALQRVGAGIADLDIGDHAGFFDETGDSQPRRFNPLLHDYPPG
jgi:hypothetical protein